MHTLYFYTRRFINDIPQCHTQSLDLDFSLQQILFFSLRGKVQDNRITRIKFIWIGITFSLLWNEMLYSAGEKTWSIVVEFSWLPNPVWLCIVCCSYLHIQPLILSQNHFCTVTSTRLRRDIVAPATGEYLETLKEGRKDSVYKETQGDIYSTRDELIIV